MTTQDSQKKYSLSQEQRILKESAADFFSTACPLEKVKELIETDQPYNRELWLKMVEQGYLGLLLPEGSGGLAWGPMELAIISEEMGRACLPGPFICNLWGSCIMERAVTGAQRERLLAEIVKGEKTLTVAFLQQKDREAPAPAELNAETNGDGYLFTGESIHVMDGEHADHVLITARDPGRESILAVIALDSPGLTLTRVPGLDHMRPCYLVRCSSVPVTKERLLAVGDSADSAIAYGTSIATLAATAEMIGTMQWILKATMASAKKREQTGQAIEAFKNIPPRCADLLAAVENCRSAVYSAALALEEADADAVAAVFLAKTLSAETSDALGSLLLQRQEGMDLTWEHDLHLFRSVPPFFNSIL